MVRICSKLRSMISMERTIKKNKKGEIKIEEKGTMEEYTAFDEWCEEGDPAE